MQSGKRYYYSGIERHMEIESSNVSFVLFQILIGLHGVSPVPELNAGGRHTVTVGQNPEPGPAD